MISYFGGPEGAGKSALMTRYARIHHLMGGHIWAFPGYELKNQRGRVISRLVMPEEVMSLVDDMQYIVLLIDEIQNFINHHYWQSKLADVLTYGAAAQRRKRQFVLLATGPQFNWLPPDLRGMFHVVFHCRDMRWRDKTLPRGERIAFVEQDMRGVLSGWPGSALPERIFWPSKYFQFYDTFSLVDPKYQNLRIKVKKDEVIVDSQGRVLDGDRYQTDPETMNRLIAQYSEQQEDKLTIQVNEVFRNFESKGLESIDSSLLWDIFNVKNHGQKTVIGKRIPENWKYRDFDKKYIKVVG